MSRTVAAEFTFCLAVPVMFGASLLKIVKYGLDFTGLQIGILLVGMVVAFLVSLLAIKGWYRIGLGVVVILLFLLHVI